MKHITCIVFYYFLLSIFFSCCIIIWNWFLCVHYLLVQKIICITGSMKSRQLWFFLSLLIHVPKSSENWGFDGKTFFVFLLSDVNGTLTSFLFKQYFILKWNRIGQQASFLTSCKEIINEIEKICSANLLKKNLPVSNSILPTITVPFLAVFRNVKRQSHNTISMEFLVFV